MALESITGLSRFRSVDKYTDNLFGESYPISANRISLTKDITDNEICNGKHENTTLGFRYEGGIILCADSLGTDGEARSIVEVDKHILGTINGCSADCSYWYRALSRECRLYNLSNKHRMPVKIASKMLSNMAYRFKDGDFCLGMMLASFDPVSGATLMHVDSKGGNKEINCLVLGSGEIYATNTLERFYKWDMKNDEAYDLALRAFNQSAEKARIVSLFHIRKDGWSRVTSKTSKELEELYACDAISGFEEYNVDKFKVIF